MLMSLAALALVIRHIALYGTAPRPDEGADVHLWQLLMLAQIPAMIYFGVRWLPETPRSALSMLLAQLACAGLAIAPLWWLGGL